MYIHCKLKLQKSLLRNYNIIKETSNIQLDFEVEVRFKNVNSFPVKFIHTLLTFARDRPFNLKGGLWFFVSLRIFFSGNTRVRIIFFQNLTLDYMTKTLNQIIFFPPPKSEYFFQQHWESEYFFQKKTIQVKWSFPYLMKCNSEENRMHRLIRTDINQNINLCIQ